MLSSQNNVLCILILYKLFVKFNMFFNKGRHKIVSMIITFNIFPESPLTKEVGGSKVAEENK